MAQPEFHDGSWWFRQPDGSLLRWDPGTQAWVAAGPGARVGPEVPVPAGQAEPWEPLRGRAQATRILLYVLAALSAVAIISGAFEISMLARMQDGESVSDAEIDFNDAREGVIAIVQSGVLLASVVVFLMWFSRAYRNVSRLGVRSLRYKPGWAIGAWFVPILNLFRPKQIANDIWRGSDPDLPREVSAAGWQDGRIPGLLFGLWWALWLITNWAGIAATRGSTETIPDLKDQSIRYLISDTTDLIAALLCAAVVAAVTRRQDERARRHGVTAAV
jgi:hypothetical protein